VVILGAGYDSRAYRMQGSRRGATVFDVELPPMQELKNLRVREVLGRAPDNVVFVPIDLKTEDLGPALRKAGYRRDCKTVFVVLVGRFEQRHRLRIKRACRGSTQCSWRCIRAAIFSRVGDAIGRLQFDVIRSHVIRQDGPRRSPAAAFRGARQSPVAWPEWSQRNGQAADRRGASPSGSASFGHCSRSARIFRPAPRSSTGTRDGAQEVGEARGGSRKRLDENPRCSLSRPTNPLKYN
jgi:hypothetical protein